MQAVENEPLQTDSEFVRLCLQQGRLQTFTPAPLGEDRQRFMALVEDMRRHGADYTTQLSMLTLAGLNRGGEQRESTHALIADLLQRTDIREKEEQQLQLWQSRLVLKLGEWFDQQQADIDHALERIVSRQNTLLQELREEEEDNPFSLTAGLGESSRASDPLLRHRLKAWARLCFHDQQKPPGLLVTGEAMAMEVLQEVYEKLCKQAAPTLLRLALPLTAGEKTKSPVPLVSSLPELEALVQQLSEPLSAARAGEISTAWAALSNSWQLLLERHFPAADTARGTLELVYFPGISAKRLLLEGFAGSMRIAASTDEETETGCCIGLVKR